MSDGRDVPLLALANARASSRPRRAVVLRAVAAVALLPLSFGYTIGFTSPALAQLSEELSLSAFAGSAFASLVNVGAMVGAIAAWRLSDALGRQRTIALWAGATIVGYLLIAAAPAGAVGLVIGRVVAGCAIGGSSVTVNVYVAEVSPPELRGALGAVFQCAVTLGILAVYGLGLVVRWRALAIIGAAPPLLLLLAARALVPETPRWLLLVKGDLPGARRAMVHLRAGADDESVDDELEDLARAQPADVDDDDAVRARNYAPPSLSEADCCGRGAAHDERPNPRATGAAAHAERSGVLSDEAMSAAVAVAEQESCAEPCEAHAAQPQQQQEASAGPDVGAQAAADGDVEAHAGVDDAVARRAAPAPEPRAPPGAAPRVSARGAASQPPPLPSLCGADRWVLRPLAISMCLMLLQQGSGINAVIFFAQRILADAGYAAPSAALAVAAAQVAAPRRAAWHALGDSPSSPAPAASAHATPLPRA